MTSRQAGDLHRFFADYAAGALGEEPERLAAFYAESFLVAGPQGSAAFKNDDTFLTWLRDVHAFNRASGMIGMNVLSVEEHRLSDQFTVATVTWDARFRKTGDEPITFTISYLVQVKDGAYTLLGYVSHEDQMEAMQARGLI